MPLGRSRVGLVRLLGGERELLDREIEPDREWKREQDALGALGQPGRIALLGRDVDQVGEVEVRNGPDPKDGERGEREKRDEHRETEGHLDAPDIEADEYDIA